MYHASQTRTDQSRFPITDGGKIAAHILRATHFRRAGCTCVSVTQLWLKAQYFFVCQKNRVFFIHAPCRGTCTTFIIKFQTRIMAKSQHTFFAPHICSARIAHLRVRHNFGLRLDVRYSPRLVVESFAFQKKQKCSFMHHAHGSAPNASSISKPRS